MRQSIRSGLAAMSLLALIAPATVVEAAQTRSYPWCVFYDSSTYNCGFTSYQQCMATAQGGQGFCRPNPFVAQSGQQQRRTRRQY
jgi:hypothetical protein